VDRLPPSRARSGPAVVVVEREVAGFGASGRNGGWCSALFPVAALAAEMRPALAATVDEVGAVAAAEGIHCDFAKDGYLCVATTPAQAARLRAEAGDWLDADQVADRVRVAGALGGVFDPDCAAALAGKAGRGLARLSSGAG